MTLFEEAQELVGREHRGGGAVKDVIRDRLLLFVQPANAFLRRDPIGAPAIQ